MENLIIILLIIPIAFTSYTAFHNPETMNKLQFNAYAIHHHKQWYRFFSYAFVHADWVHLLLNMYVLWAFGDIVMMFFRYYFANLANLYFLGLFIPATGISVIWSYFRHRNDAYYNAVGASGAVSAVVFASIILYPHGKMGLLFFPVMIPSWIFGILYLVYTIVMAKRGNDNIGHDAHLWGAVYGILYTLLTVPGAYENFVTGIF
jgi:membrane associated rhomboid family serine protease